MKTRNTTDRGYTITEMMIIMMTIGLIASIAWPAFMKYQKHAQNAAFVANLRGASDAFVMYSFEERHYPPNGAPGVVPAGMEVYLTKFPWAKETPIGGRWKWDHDIDGYKAGVTVFGPTADLAQMADIDFMIDDRNLGQGRFHARSGGYVLVLEE